MANPLYNRFNGGNNGMNDIGSSFKAFMEQNKGADANKMLADLVNNGKVSQQQLNMAQNYAQQLGGMLSQFKGMFGF